MEKVTELDKKRKQLQNVLKDNYKLFISKMKLWFTKSISREEFDLEVRQLFTPKTVHVYTEFILAFCEECGITNPPSSESDSDDANRIPNKGKLPKKSLKGKSPSQQVAKHDFKPADVAKFIPKATASTSKDDNQTFLCTNEASLPDAALLRGRVLLTAWERGLEQVSDDVVPMVISAVQNYMQNIISTVMTRRSSYKIRERRFRYAIGCPPSNHYLRNNPKRPSFFSHRQFAPSTAASLDFAESDAAMEIACDNAAFKDQTPLSAHDLFNTLQVHRNLLASHTVYSVNVERVITRLHHPSIEEVDQENITKQEKKLKTSITNEMTFPTPE